MRYNTVDIASWFLSFTEPVNLLAASNLTFDCEVRFNELFQSRIDILSHIFLVHLVDYILPVRKHAWWEDLVDDVVASDRAATVPAHARVDVPQVGVDAGVHFFHHTGRVRAADAGSATAVAH